MAIRFYAYQFYENTYPITKFYFGDIGTPNGAIHNRASMGGETTALCDIGLETWGTAYEDGLEAQTVVAWGANLYECQDIYFQEHIVPGQAPDRRRRSAADLHRGLRRRHRRWRPSPARPRHRRGTQSAPAKEGIRCRDPRRRHGIRWHGRSETPPVPQVW